MLGGGGGGLKEVTATAAGKVVEAEVHQQFTATHTNASVSTLPSLHTPKRSSHTVSNWLTDTENSFTAAECIQFSLPPIRIKNK